VNCEGRVPLWDEIEELFASEEMREKALGVSATEVGGSHLRERVRRIVFEGSGFDVTSVRRRRERVLKGVVAN
jgi:hypothetical protein